MRRKSFMVVAGEASGDWLAAELVRALRDELTTMEAVPTWDYQPLHASLEPRFFGAGGPQMAAAGVELAFELTAHSVIGLSGALKGYFKFRRFLHRLCDLAQEREPDAIICVDFAGFNRRLAQAIKSSVRGRVDWFHDWDPKLIQYVSPQIWASRESRAYQLARDYDLLLSIFPFEKQLYGRLVPALPVDFIGNPLLDRYAGLNSHQSLETPVNDPPSLLLLPGSRPGELRRHIPVMNGALSLVRKSLPNIRARMVLPNESLLAQAKGMKLLAEVVLQSGNLPEALKSADAALSKTGTISMECAYWGVPTVAFYKTSRFNYEVGKRMVRVNYLAMPNLLANEEVFPEFVQDAATSENLARAVLELLTNQSRRRTIKAKLAQVISQLGPPGASRRAAQAILRLVAPELPAATPALLRAERDGFMQPAY